MHDSNGVISENGRAATVSPPYVLSWNDPAHPLPVRSVTPARRKGNNLGRQAPPWLETGPEDQPFDFCAAMRMLCADIAIRCKELAHVDPSRLLFAITQSRTGRLHGLQARVTPLRFEKGQLIRHRRGVPFQVQRYLVDGREMLYLVTFCLPRFLDQSFDEKIITVFHELYHIGPSFDGDLRRHQGRCALHTHSKKQYDLHMADLSRSYLSNGARSSLHAFLRLNFGQLHERHGRVIGAVVPRPRLIPLPPMLGERPA